MDSFDTDSFDKGGKLAASQATSYHLGRARQGDALSLEWLVERLTPILLAQARYRLGSRLRGIVEPEDVINDVWLMALPQLAGLSARDGRYTPVLMRFLGQILVRRVNALLRRVLIDRGRGGHDEPGEAPGVEALPKDTVGIVTRVVRKATGTHVLEAIERLPPDDRAIVILRGIEQLPNQVVAERIGITPGHAAVRYHRALEKLRASLPGSVFDEFP